MKNQKENKDKDKVTNILRLLLPFPFRSNKSVSEKSKFYKDNQLAKSKLYEQVSKRSINDIVKIKNVFSKLLSNKILEIHKVINEIYNKKKSKLNIMTKDLLHKQIIIPMGFNNAKRVMAQFNIHVSNINKSFKGIKSEITINFIRSDNKDIIVITNKVIATSNLNIVEEYCKNLNNVNLSDVMSPRLPQSKSYLKILDILYFVENTNLSLTSNIIEKVIKTTYIFNNVILASHLCVIKMSPKSGMAVIWINI